MSGVSISNGMKLDRLLFEQHGFPDAAEEEAARAKKLEAAKKEKGEQ